MITQITIGIQARSTSKRFPQKVFEILGSKSVLNHVVDSCFESANYINRYGDRNKAYVSVALCIPTGDPIKEKYKGRADVVEGPEDDVLARYLKLSEQFKSDYIVRVTGDCPLIPAFVISKCITCAIMNKYDYISNVDETCRTTIDGWDCEVFSARLLKYAAETAIDPSDREHVTTFMRSHPPNWAKRGAIVNFLDLAHLKLSLDTREDLEKIKEAYSRVDKAVKTAEGIYGKSSVHRL